MDKEQLEVGEVADIVSQMLLDDRNRDEFYTKVDKAVACEFEPDAAIRNLPWIGNRGHGSTKIADARNAAVSTFSTLLPRINVSPLNDEDYEYHRVETAEQVLEWEFTKMNKTGKKPVHVEIVSDAVTYHSVAFQVLDLEHYYKDYKNDPRVRAMLRQRRFSWVRHHPGTVHTRTSENGLECVAKYGEYTLQALMDNFGTENEGVKALLAEHRNASRAERLTLKYNLVDYMDWTHRVQFAVASSTPSPSKFVFMNTKHELPFLPWVVVDYGDPLWKSLIQSGAWENFQYLKLIRFSKAVEQGTSPYYMFQTPDGTLQRVWIDYSNPSSPVVTPLDGTHVQNFPRPQIDPQLESQYAEMAGEADASTVARVLQDITPYINAPFSSLNAATSHAMGRLSPAQQTAEQAEAAGFEKMIEWINYTNKPLMGYRKYTSDSRVKESDRAGKGEVIGIYPAKGEFIPKEDEVEAMDEKQYKAMLGKAFVGIDGLYLDVKLQPFNASDEQARMNTQILAVEKMGVSQQQAYENMGWKNYQLIKNQRAQEQMDEAKLQTYIQMQMQQAQLQLQMQAQQQAQPQAPQNAVNDMNAANQFASLQGADMRGGGMPAAPVAPNETREQITGQTQGGQSLA